MKDPERILVPDVPAAAAWYARVFDAEIDASGTRISRGTAGALIELVHGPPQPRAGTVLEFCVDDVRSWLDPALAAGATLLTPGPIGDFAQFRDPWGYIWTLTTASATG